MRIWVALLATSATLSLAPSAWADDEKPADGDGDKAGLFAKLDAVAGRVLKA